MSWDKLFQVPVNSCVLLIMNLFFFFDLAPLILYFSLISFLFSSDQLDLVIDEFLALLAICSSLCVIPTKFFLAFLLEISLISLALSIPTISSHFFPLFVICKPLSKFSFLVLTYLFK